MGLFFNQSKPLAERYVDAEKKTEQSLNNSEQVVYTISPRAYLDYLDNKTESNSSKTISGGRSFRASAAEDEDRPA